MGIFSGLTNIVKEIKKIDKSIDTHGRDFSELYEKNARLEEEIALRTKELEQANKTILTLNSVWDMMNSSQPLSNMLDNIVHILHEDMNYSFAAILKLVHDDEKNNLYFEVKSDSSSKSVAKAFSIINQSIATYKLPYIENSIVVKSINERKIYSTPDLKGMVKLFFPLLSEDQIKDVMTGINSKSCSVVPLNNGNEKFGCVIVASDRDGITDTESNFLSLYANQIELAITVAGLFEEVKKQAITDPLTGLFNTDILKKISKKKQKEH